MTKKDYELFANEIYNLGFLEPIQAVELTNLCAHVFKKDNPLFQPDKFRVACVTGKHIRKTIKG